MFTTRRPVETNRLSASAGRFTDTAPDAPGQLYNLGADPGEKNNLHFKHPEIVKELKALLDASKASGRRKSKTE